MKEAVDYAVEQLKKSGYAVDPVVSRRIVGYVIEYIASEVKEMKTVEITGLGSFKKEIKPSRKFYSALFKKEVETKPKTVLKFSPTRRFMEKIGYEDK